MMTKKEPDGQHPPSHYLIVEDPEHPSTWHLRVRDADGRVNHNLMGAAWAALHGGYRGNKYEGPGKEAAIEKLKSLYRLEGMGLPDAQGSESPITYHKPQITNSEGPRFVVLLGEPPRAGLIRIPIAITGKWKGADREFSVGLDDLNEIRENFARKPTGEINVDYEHASEVPFGTGGPVLSAGRVVKLDSPEMFKNGSGQMGNSADGGPSAHLPTSPSAKYILWGWYEPTSRARELIAHKEYRYISPAIRWGAKDKVSGKVIGTVLTSVALVNKPFLEELPQLELSDAAGDQKILVSLGQLHVPGPVNQVSVAYQQPEQDSRFRIKGSGKKPESLSAKEKEMAKTLKLKCLTDEHVEKYGLGPEHKGKIGVFDGEELIGVAPPPDGWEPIDGAGDGDGENGKKLAERFAAEIGLPGTSFVDIAAMVKRGREAQLDQFAALSESIHDGRINLLEAGKLADVGRVTFSTILQAQEAERKVEAAVRAGKVLPKNRAHALKLALSDAACFAALIEQSKPAVDLRAHGHAGGGEQPTAQQVLMGEVKAYAKEHQCAVSVALSEVTKARPDLWRQYSEEIVIAVEAGEEEEE